MFIEIKIEIKNRTVIVTKDLTMRFCFGGEKGIRTPGTVITVHMISNHAPSASSDISPSTVCYYNK